MCDVQKEEQILINAEMFYDKLNAKWYRWRERERTTYENIRDNDDSNKKCPAY